MFKTKIVETFTGQSVSDFGTKLRKEERKKENICVSFRKNCAKVLRMETLSATNVGI